MFNYDRPWVKLGGGEAFFYQDEMIAMISYLLDLRNILPQTPEIVLQTNGTLFTDDFFKRFSGNANLSINLSLDGGPAIQNQQRDNSFDKIPLQRLKDNFPNIKIFSTFLKKNYKEIPDSIDFIRGYGFKSIQICLDRYDSYDDIGKELLEIEKQIGLKINFPGKQNFNSKFDPDAFIDTIRTIVINPFGNYWICNHPPVQMDDEQGYVGNINSGFNIAEYKKVTKNLVDTQLKGVVK